MEDTSSQSTAETVSNQKKMKKPVPKFRLSDSETVLAPLLRGLRPAPYVFGIPDDRQEEGDEEGNSVTLPETSQQSSCSSCAAVFATPAEQREHFKKDWHRFNLKQKLEGKAMVKEEAFETMLEKGDGDDISLSGSDEDDEEEDDQGNLERKQRHPRLFFENAEGQLMSVLKCLLFAGKRGEESELPDENWLPLIPKISRTNWAIFMLGGGHFAGAVFSGKEPIVHKTFHCYTVRAKQGGSQSSADNKSGGSHPKSAGASLRRYNEAALVQHVQDIVKLWGPELSKCGLIFYRSSSNSRTVLFGGKEPPLDKRDERLRSIPFVTKRATFNEVKRIHEVLTTIEMHGDGKSYVELSSEPSASRRVTKKKASPSKNIRRSRSRKEVSRPLPDLVQRLADEGNSEEEEEGPWQLENVELSTGHLAEFENTKPPPRRSKKNKMPHLTVVEDPRMAELNEAHGKLVTACKCGDLRALNECMDRLKIIEGEDFSEKKTLNLQFGSNLVTPLHLATSAGQKSLIKYLLDNGGDPCVKDKAKRVPYTLCPDKETRVLYRNFREQNPDAFDYSGSQIPPPATEAEEERQREKKKIQRQVKKEKEKAKKEVTKEAQKEEEEKNRYLALSDREKRALAAERRILTQKVESGEARPVLLRCFQCATDMTGKVPFEYGVFKFCSVRCVKDHRQKASA